MSGILTGFQAAGHEGGASETLDEIEERLISRGPAMLKEAYLGAWGLL